MLRFHPSQADEHGGQHGEDHGLDETYQALKTHHKDAHQYAQCRHGELDGYGLTCHQEDDASDSHGNSVTCHHVGKRRIISAKGFVKIPTNSMTGMMGIGAFNQVGTSGQKISFQ